MPTRCCHMHLVCNARSFSHNSSFPPFFFVFYPIHYFFILKSEEVHAFVNLSPAGKHSLHQLAKVAQGHCQTSADHSLVVNMPKCPLMLPYAMHNLASITPFPPLSSLFFIPLTGSSPLHPEEVHAFSLYPCGDHAQLFDLCNSHDLYSSETFISEHA